MDATNSPADHCPALELAIVEVEMKDAFPAQNAQAIDWDAFDAALENLSK